MKDGNLVQCLNDSHVEYTISLDVAEGRDSLAVFIKPTFRNHVKFDKEIWQKILELPTAVVWDMLRNNLASGDFSKDQPELIRRRNEALAAEKYLEEYEKT